MTASADFIVVGAGSIGSPAILIRSGVGPEKRLQDRGATRYHPVATLRMGIANAAVTPRLAIAGTTNLWTAVASIKPAITSANTNAPSMMNGYGAAEFISEDAA